MKNITKLYARALAEVISKKPASAQEVSAWQSNFVKILVKAGLENKVKEILDLTEDLVLAKQGNSKITIETARKILVSQKKMIEKFVNKGDVVKEKISPELIAGVKITINGSKQFDASMLNKLNNIL